VAWHWLFVVGIVLSCLSCTSAISSAIRSQVAQDVTYTDIAQNPDAYIGKIIIAAGSIIDAKNLREGTRLEILQYPTTNTGRPVLDNPSGGRFLVLLPNYLETAIYRPGRRITVAGEVSGHRDLPLGETTYRYPVFVPHELYLWPEGYRGPRVQIGFGFGFSKGL
jgi:outer membrane lipoprotein